MNKHYYVLRRIRKGLSSTWITGTLEDCKQELKECLAEIKPDSQVVWQIVEIIQTETLIEEVKREVPF